MASEAAAPDAQRRLRISLALAMLLGLLACSNRGLGSTLAAPSVTPSITPSAAPEPIVPTATPANPDMPAAPSPTPGLPVATETVTPASVIPEPSPTATASPNATPGVAATRVPTRSKELGDDPVPLVPVEDRRRLCVSLPSWRGNPATLAALQVGWVMDWHVLEKSPYGGAVEHVQTVSLGGGELPVDSATLSSYAAARPGATWLISNEPDVKWQDNIRPSVYAELYQEAHSAIKSADASAVVAAGGIAQATDLRLAYLDAVLDAYRMAYGVSLPADAWHIHNYMLREERDSWGVDIPPGFAQETGALYEIEDSGNLDAFRTHIERFRTWMAARGYGGLPLMVSEFGIPMPADYGFPPDVVAAFLREATSYFLTASDPLLGNPADGGRLVQRWCWFSIEYADYPTGNLLDSAANRWTELGYAWLAMVAD